MPNFKLERRFYSTNGSCFQEANMLTDNEKQRAGRLHDGWLVQDDADDCYGWADNGGETWDTASEALEAYRQTLAVNTDPDGCDDEDREYAGVFESWAKEQHRL